MTNRCSRKDEALLGRTILELAEKLSGEELKVSDLLRLLDLSEDLEADDDAPLIAGWSRE